MLVLLFTSQTAIILQYRLSILLEPYAGGYPYVIGSLIPTVRSQKLVKKALYQVLL